MDDRQFRSLIKKMPVGFALHEVICDEEGAVKDYRYLEVNDTFEELLGLKAEEVLGKRVLELFPDLETYWIEIFGKVALSGQSEEYVNYFETLRKYFHVHIYCPAKGQFATVFTDITEKRTTEEALRLSEERLRDIVDCSFEWVWEVDPQMRFTYTDSSSEQVLGFSRSEIIGKTPFDFMPPEEAERIKQIALGIIAKQEPFSHLDTLNYRKDGSTIVLSVSGVPIYSSGGVFEGYRGVGMDVTEQRNMVDKLNTTVGALTESEERFRSLQEFLPTPIGLHESGHFIDANNALVDLFGYSIEDLRAHGGLELIAEDSRETVRQKIAEGSNAPYEINGLRKDGTVFPMEVQGKNVPYKNKILRITEFRDLTDRKKADNKLRQSQKLEALGQLTGGIAHDFNNILNIIQGNLELLKIKTSGDEEVGARLEKALKGTRRAAKLTERLLGFSRAQTQAAQLTHLNDFIEDIKDLIIKSLTVTIEVETHLAANLWLVNVDHGDLEDALLNLALNARDAMPKGGSLIIETANQRLHADYAEKNQLEKPGDYVMISVTDTGSGMTEETMQRVYEPFFSSKPVGKGTGLGLSMVYGFIQRAKGHIRLHSELGKGTTFRIYLPRAVQEKPTRRSRWTSLIAMPRGKETILVVDDEKDMVQIASDHLKQLGYAVFTAHRGAEALDILDREKGIDLLFSDIIMPGGLDGYELAIKTSKKHPKVKILLTSGYSRNREEDLKQDNPIIEHLSKTLLRKPYNKAQLAQSIRLVLDNEEVS